MNLLKFKTKRIPYVAPENIMVHSKDCLVKVFDNLKRLKVREEAKLGMTAPSHESQFEGLFNSRFRFFKTKTRAEK